MLNQIDKPWSKRVIWGILLLLPIGLLNGCAKQPAANPFFPNIRSSHRPEAPVAAIMIAGGLSIPAIVIIWKDGEIVWSKDPVNGGAPYFAGRLSPSEISGCLQALESDGLLSDSFSDQRYYVFDSPHSVIEAHVGKKDFHLMSYHEIYEDDASTVVTANSVRMLNEGENREDVLRSQPPRYREFRRVWHEVRTALYGLIPQDGAIEVNVTFSDGE